MNSYTIFDKTGNPVANSFSLTVVKSYCKGHIGSKYLKLPLIKGSDDKITVQQNLDPTDALEEMDSLNEKNI